MSNALEFFGLSDTATVAEVKAAYRERARIAHPDVGGDPDAFVELNERYQEALAAAALTPCAVCAGSGRVRVGAGGFVPLTRTCDVCGGSGRRNP